MMTQQQTRPTYQVLIDKGWTPEQIQAGFRALDTVDRIVREVQKRRAAATQGR